MCNGPTEGYKCDVCGSESAEHDANHEHGGEHCVAKCQTCNEAETKCTCST